nr:MAG TPA: protein of unknown function (DUF4355) [Caudoviricetes sp.]
MTGDIRRGIIVLTREEVLQLIEEVVEKYQNGNQAGEAQAATSANQPAGKNVEAETAEDNGEETAAPGGDTSTPESDADAEADNAAEPQEDSATSQQEQSADGKDAAPGGDTETGSDLETALKKIHKLNRENQALRQRAKESEQKIRQYEIPKKAGVPAELSEWVRGSTDEEMEEDAKRLAEALNNIQKPSPGTKRKSFFDGLAQDSRGTKPEDETDLSKIGERIYKR